MGWGGRPELGLGTHGGWVGCSWFGWARGSHEEWGLGMCMDRVGCVENLIREWGIGPVMGY